MIVDKIYKRVLRINFCTVSSFDRLFLYHPPSYILHIDWLVLYLFWVLPGSSVVKKKKNPPVSVGDTGDVGSSPGLERSPGGGNSNPLQYSYRRNLMDRGACWATVQGVAKTSTHLSTKQQQNHSANSIPCIATVRLAKTPPCIVWTAQSAHDFPELLWIDSLTCGKD